MDNDMKVYCGIYSASFNNKLNNREIRINDLLDFDYNQLNQLFDLDLTLVDRFENNIEKKIIRDDDFIIKLSDLYSFNKDYYKDVIQSLSFIADYFNENDTNIFSEIYYSSIEELRDKCFRILKDYISSGKNYDVNKLPKNFLDYAKDILNIDESIPSDVQDRFNNHKLTVDDIIDNIDSFMNLKIGEYIDPLEINIKSAKAVNIVSEYFETVDKIFHGKFNEIIKYNPEQIRYILKADLADAFLYFLYDHNVSRQEIDAKNLNIFDNFFNMYDELVTPSKFNNYKPSLFRLRDDEETIVNLFGFENLKHFDEESGFITNNLDNNDHICMLRTMYSYWLKLYNEDKEEQYDHEEELTYEEAKKRLIDFISNMIHDGFLKSYYLANHRISFKKTFLLQNPGKFLNINAPVDLYAHFYEGDLNPNIIRTNLESIEYIMPFDLEKLFNYSTTIEIKKEASLDKQKEYAKIQQENNLNSEELFKKYNILFVDGKYYELCKVSYTQKYIEKYGKKAFIELFARYGDLFCVNNDGLKFDYEDRYLNNEELLTKYLAEEKLMDYIYERIINDYKLEYRFLITNRKFIDRHPDIFTSTIDFNNIKLENSSVLVDHFYEGTLTFDTLMCYPSLIDVLEHKTINNVFSLYLLGKVNGSEEILQFFNRLINYIGKRPFLELCQKYGDRLASIYTTINIKNKMEYKNGAFLDTLNGKQLSSDDINKIIEDEIVSNCIKAEFPYYEHDLFLKKRVPELFLDDNVPNDLKEAFYNSNIPFNFSVLHDHKEWLPYLEGKRIDVRLILKNEYPYALADYFRIFGYKDGIQQGINRPISVTKMIENGKIELMKQWFDKTGGKFVPDYIIMQNFPLEEANKFLAFGGNWSKLCKIEEFAESEESRDAMLKMAYIFGCFDNDARGFQKVIELLTEIPRKIDKDDASLIVICMDDIKREKLKKVYDINNDGSLFLKIDIQKDHKTEKELRKLLEEYIELHLLTPIKIHEIFGGMSLTYDPYFRDFLLSNWNKILDDEDNWKCLPSIQRQFSHIKTVNSNRVLTWELALGSVKDDTYINVEVGNEKISEVASMAGYSQNDFETLQQIYNFGKQRTFSSIPRIVKQYGNYTYEILRLDDPLAMAIGTLSDCCQQLDDVAEVCMEHSMVDKDGRIFVVKDEIGNIVAQSWVWRNGSILCFDNIEIPHKAFTRAEKQHINLTEEVFDIYKDASKELMKYDETVYKQLLASGKISEKIYNNYRLGKITVGLGFNDIAEEIKSKAHLDEGEIARPLNFSPPVELRRGLYTNDSRIQYILEERKDNPNYTGSTITPYHDSYNIYDVSNFKPDLIHILQQFELITKKRDYNLTTDVYFSEKAENVLQEMAYHCGLEPNNIKILISPNFVIIFDVYGDTLRIGDLYYNFNVNDNIEAINIENVVLMQIKMALSQIIGGLKLDYSKLDDSQKEIINKCINLDSIINQERYTSRKK